MRRRGNDDERPSQEPLSWPEGFLATPRDRMALVVLLTLPTITPRPLLELASGRGTAWHPSRDEKVRCSLIPTAFQDQSMKRTLAKTVKTGTGSSSTVPPKKGA